MSGFSIETPGHGTSVTSLSSSAETGRRQWNFHFLKQNTLPSRDACIYTVTIYGLNTIHSPLEMHAYSNHIGLEQNTLVSRDARDIVLICRWESRTLIVIISGLVHSHVQSSPVKVLHPSPPGEFHFHFHYVPTVAFLHLDEAFMSHKNKSHRTADDISDTDWMKGRSVSWFSFFYKSLIFLIYISCSSGQSVLCATHLMAHITLCPLGHDIYVGETNKDW